MSFKSHCLEIGIVLKDEDIILIKKKLSFADPSLHRGIMERYIEIWMEVLKKEECNGAKNSLARHYANRYAQGFGV